MTMRAIYRPKGRAREYAPLAANLYKGCANRCAYCYVPRILRMGPPEFHAGVHARPGLREALQRDAARLAAAGETGPVLLCFATDPYPREVPEGGVTARQAIRILSAAGMRTRLLTKNPFLALDDLDLLEAARTEFGISLVWIQESDRMRWEPGADGVVERMAALTAARAMGVRTWVSLEPVIAPAQALEIVDFRAHLVDVWRVGGWNHDARARRIDYRAFLDELMPLLAVKRERDGCAWQIKHDLWRHASASARAYGRTAGLEEDDLV